MLYWCYTPQKGKSFAMNDHQLLCFLTVQRTLNFTAAAKELYCTQPALSYQIRSLEKELGLPLFERSTTRVVLTAAGRAFVPHAEQLYRGILNARTALKGFSDGRTLTLRLPPVLLQRDPIYPVLMERLHTALPGYEFRVDTTPPLLNAHLMLCTEADAAVLLLGRKTLCLIHEKRQPCRRCWLT